MAIHNHKSCHTHHCHAKHSPCASPTWKKVMAVAEKISLVALSVFAAYIAPKLFFPFFGGGVILSCYLHWGAKKHASHREESIGCSQGFLEQLTGVRLPPPLGLAANIAIAVCHIDHHQEVFVPLIGLNAGMWVGKLLAEQLSSPNRKITPLTPAA